MIVNKVTDKMIKDESRKNWLNYWSHFANSDTCHCSEVNCTHKHEHGVLVKLGSKLKDKIYVVPMCKEHGYAEQKRLELSEDVELVSAEFCL